MNKNNLKLKIHIMILTILSVAAVVLRTLACFYDLDYASGYFGEKSLITASYVIISVAVLSAVFYVIGSKKESRKIPFTSAVNYVPTGLVATALVFLVFKLYAEVRANGIYTNLRVLNPTSVLQLICAVMGVLSVVHFFLNAFLPQNKTDVRAHFAIATVLFLAFYSVYLYFDSSDLPINSPNKIVDQMAYLSSSLFFLYEARISLGREKGRHYLTFSLISMALTAYSSIPSLILYIGKGEYTSAAIEENLLTFTLFLFIATRLILIAALPSSEKNDNALSALTKYAEERQIENDRASAAYNEAFAVQMTIEDLEEGKNALGSPELDETDDISPVSEAESTEDFSSAETLFEEDTLLSNEDGNQIELSYEIFEKFPEKETRVQDTENL